MPPLRSARALLMCTKYTTLLPFPAALHTKLVETPLQATYRPRWRKLTKAIGRPRLAYGDPRKPFGTGGRTLRISPPPPPARVFRCSVGGFCDQRPGGAPTNCVLYRIFRRPVYSVSRGRLSPGVGRLVAPVGTGGRECTIVLPSQTSPYRSSTSSQPSRPLHCTNPAGGSLGRKRDKNTFSSQRQRQ